MALDTTTPITFGIHAGKSWESLPQKYLEWLVASAKVSHVRKMAKAALKMHSPKARLQRDRMIHAQRRRQANVEKYEAEKAAAAQKFASPEL